MAPSSNPPVRIAICGGFQSGKSLLTNCLLRRRVAKIGRGALTTVTAVSYEWGETERVEILNREGRAVPYAKTKPAILPLARFLEKYDELMRALVQAPEESSVVQPRSIRVLLPIAELRQVTLIDTPGLDSTSDATERAERAASQADFVLFVARNRQISGVEREFLARRSAACQPFSVLFNCFEHPETWAPDAPANWALAEEWFAPLRRLRHYAIDRERMFNLHWWATAEGVAGNHAAEGAAWRQAMENYLAHAHETPEGRLNALLVGAEHERIRAFVLVPPLRTAGWNAPCLARQFRRWAAWTNGAQAPLSALRSFAA